LLGNIPFLGPPHADKVAAVIDVSMQ